MQIDSSIFKAYDIRGVVDKTLTEEAARAIGQALGALAKEKSVDTMCVGRDGRLWKVLQTWVSMSSQSA